MTVLIEAHALAKSFGPIRAVDGISLSVPKGQVLGFLGPNGAGKSTTMKMLAGFLEPDAGTARIGGFDVGAHPIEAKAKLGYLPEGAPAYAEMTAGGFLKFIAEIRGFRGAEIQRRIDAAVEKTSLKSVLAQQIDTLSKGFKRRVGIAQAILHDPDVLIMDEPTDGLDPNQKHQVRQLICDMAADKAIIVSTHILEEVDAVCTRAVVINKGRIVADGTAEELLRRGPARGSVMIRTAIANGDALRRALQGFSTVASVETVDQAYGQIRLRALPKYGAIDQADVSKALSAKAVPFDEIVAERGTLEDVFRHITTVDTGAGNA